MAIAYLAAWSGTDTSITEGGPMKRFVVIAVATSALSMGLAVPAHADDMWAAIANSPSHKDAYITSWGPLTKDQAEQGALQSCNKDGISDCQIVASSANCVALVFDSKGGHGGVGATGPAAVADAQSQAESGATVAVTKCSTEH
jgi:hypothetical protein